MSTYFSIFMQFITGSIQLDGLLVKVPPQHGVLKEVLWMDTIVQFIEASFYFWLIYNYKKVSNMAAKRYNDWAITTPIMLISTIVYMKYLETRYLVEEEKVSLSSFFANNKLNVGKITIANALMLLCGYLGEIGKISMIQSVLIGFLFFGYTFYVIYNEYAKTTPEGIHLFMFLFIVWSLYGVAATMKPKIKNISYNLLDIVSKNFYGLYIYYLVKQIAI
mgnify:CR=1 FL=1